MVRSFLERFPCLGPLVLVLKQFLQQNGLNESFTGGVGSYALVLLAISFVQLHPRLRAGRRSGMEGRREPESEQTNLGVLLLEFLELYGRDFDFANVAIRVKDGGAYMPKEALFPGTAQSGPPVVSIEDPLQPGMKTSYENVVHFLSSTMLILWGPSKTLFSPAGHHPTAQNAGRCNWKENESSNRTAQPSANADWRLVKTQETIILI